MKIFNTCDYGGLRYFYNQNITVEIAADFCELLKLRLELRRKGVLDKSNLVEDIWIIL